VKHPDPRLRAYRDLVVAEPTSLTAVRDPDAAWELLVEDALEAAALIRELGPAEAVDVGSGGGSPGIPIAIALGLPVTLLEATATKCRFLERAVAALEAPCTVVHARSEEYARGDGRDRFALALARALAPPPVAAELVLPLVATGGVAILWTGAGVDADALARAAGLVGGAVEASHSVGEARRLVILRKHDATPERFPRRPGIARARPLVPVPSFPI
jgi:16S rRNA (guanine527-N7)-methyltransferase